METIRMLVFGDGVNNFVHAEVTIQPNFKITGICIFSGLSQYGGSDTIDPEDNVSLQILDGMNAGIVLGAGVSQGMADNGIFLTPIDTKDATKLRLSYWNGDNTVPTNANLTMFATITGYYNSGLPGGP